MKHIKTILLLYSLILLGNTHAHAQLFCTNTTPEIIYIAVGYNFCPIQNEQGDIDPNLNMWITEGWLTISPQQTTQILDYIGYNKQNGYKSNLFYYAFNNTRDWKGSRKFLVDTLPPPNTNQLSFRIEQANRPDLHLQSPNLKYVPFKWVGKVTRGSYNLILSNDDLNDPPHHHPHSGEESPFDPPQTAPKPNTTPDQKEFGTPLFDIE